MSFTLFAVTYEARKKENALLYFCGNTFGVTLLTVTCTSAVLMERIVMFPWHHCLRERPAVLRYAYTLLTLFFFFTEIAAQNSKNRLTHDLIMAFLSNAPGTHLSTANSD